MIELIIVDRQDGRAVAGLLTSVLAHWDQIPLGVQAAIIADASEAAFERVGRTDGSFVVTAFVLKHRATLARQARKRNSFGFRAREAFDRMADQQQRMMDVAQKWPMSKWLASWRRAA